MENTLIGNKVRVTIANHDVFDEGDVLLVEDSFEWDVYCVDDCGHRGWIYCGDYEKVAEDSKPKENLMANIRVEGADTIAEICKKMAVKSEELAKLTKQLNEAMLGIKVVDVSDKNVSDGIYGDILLKVNSNDLLSSIDLSGVDDISISDVCNYTKKSDFSHDTAKAMPLRFQDQRTISRFPKRLGSVKDVAVFVQDMNNEIKHMIAQEALDMGKDDYVIVDFCKPKIIIKNTEEESTITLVHLLDVVCTK